MGAIDGQLFWTPESSKAPLAVIVLGVVIVARGPRCSCCSCAGAARARRPAGGGGAGTAGGPGGPPERRGERVLDFAAMAPLACLMHWYISMMYVVPVVAVGGWGWLELQADGAPQGGRGGRAAGAAAAPCGGTARDAG